METDDPPTALLDKLGERCAYERAAMRLYQLLIGRFEAFGESDVGPTLDQLRRFLADEARHFELMVGAIRALGADTALPAGADTTALPAQGIAQLLVDPRTSPTECLNAMLIVELVDRDGWERLIELLRATGRRQLAETLTVALTDGELHLGQLRQWLAEMTWAGARVEPLEEVGGDPPQLWREQQQRL
jgi:hypothetical protein